MKFSENICIYWCSFSVLEKTWHSFRHLHDKKHQLLTFLNQQMLNEFFIFLPQKSFWGICLIEKVHPKPRETTAQILHVGTAQFPIHTSNHSNFLGKNFYQNKWPIQEQNNVHFSTLSMIVCLAFFHNCVKLGLIINCLWRAYVNNHQRCMIC